MTGQQGEVEYMKKLNVALVGFGSLGQSFARILLEKKEEIEKEYETTVNVVAITTKTRGNLVDAWGIDLARVLKNVEETGVFPNQHKTVLHKTSLEIAEAVDYDVLIEMTPLDMNEGQVATEHIMAALKRGKHVICANKGPLAWHYRELMELADENNCKLLFESTVMDGAPLFSLIRESLKMCEITEIKRYPQQYDKLYPAGDRTGQGYEGYRKREQEERLYRGEPEIRCRRNGSCS